MKTPNELNELRASLREIYTRAISDALDTENSYDDVRSEIEIALNVDDDNQIVRDAIDDELFVALNVDETFESNNAIRRCTIERKLSRYVGAITRRDDELNDSRVRVAFVALVDALVDATSNVALLVNNNKTE